MCAHFYQLQLSPDFLIYTQVKSSRSKKNCQSSNFTLQCEALFLSEIIIIIHNISIYLKKVSYKVIIVIQTIYDSTIKIQASL